MHLLETLHILFAVFVLWMTFHAVFIDRKERRSPAAYRRERAFRRAELGARRYRALPPVRRLSTLRSASGKS